jgi:hypothetical protein
MPNPNGVFVGVCDQCADDERAVASLPPRGHGHSRAHGTNVNPTTTKEKA